MEFSLFGYGVLALATVIIFRFLKNFYINRDLPPGPIGIPLIGYGPFLGKRPDRTLAKLGKQYGDIFTINLGQKRIIVVNSYKAIHAAFIGQGDAFAGKGFNSLARQIAIGKDGEIHGILRTVGERWRVHRKFMLQIFRDLGVGKGKIEMKILEETDQMMDAIAKNANRPYIPIPLFIRGVANVICGLCFGKIFSHSDAQFNQLINNSADLNAYFGKVGMLGNYPILRFLPNFKAKYERFLELVEESKTLAQQEIDEHQKLVDKTEPDDYIDAFLIHKRNLENSDPNGDLKYFSQDDLFMNVQQLFTAGTESTKVTLTWIVLYMLHYRDVQEKVQREIDDHVAVDGIVTIEHRPKLIYTEAVIRESQRMSNIAPFSMRTTVKEAIVLGYRIPNKATVMTNYYAYFRDPTLFKRPNEFLPERFINEKGQLEDPPHFTPFGLGKRSCPAEALARMELFLFFSNMLKRFELRPAPGYSLPATEDCTVELACSPLPFHVEFRLRNLHGVNENKNPK